MSLKSRIDRLAHRLGTDSPREAVIFYGPRFRRHEIGSGPGGVLRLTVSCLRDSDPMEHLTPEQRHMIGLIDSVVCFEAADNPRDRLASFDDGRNEP
jgi:hypothetical protein